MGTCRRIRKGQNKVRLTFLVSHSICSNINAETASLQWTTLSQVQKSIFFATCCMKCNIWKNVDKCIHIWNDLSWIMHPWIMRKYENGELMLLIMHCCFLLLPCSFQLMVPFTSFLPYLSDMGLLLPFIVFVKSSICKRNLCCCSVSSCLQIS